MHLFNSIQRFSWFIYLFVFSIDKLPILLDNLKQIQKKLMHTIEVQIATEL